MKQKQINLIRYTCYKIVGTVAAWKQFISIKILLLFLKRVVDLVLDICLTKFKNGLVNAILSCLGQSLIWCLVFLTTLKCQQIFISVPQLGRYKNFVRVVMIIQSNQSEAIHL